MNPDLPTTRAEWFQLLVPEGPARLWCPPITHYDDHGGVDAVRTRAHLRHLARWAGGFLVPGSTGDGWQLDPGQAKEVVRLAMEVAAERKLRLLVGVLRTERESILAGLRDMAGWLAPGTVGRARLERLAALRVCGFTVCPPKGASLGPQELFQAIQAFLGTGLPISLYQLPQVTGNEVAPAEFGRLAAAHPNLLFFKDTSGRDQVVRSGLDTAGVFTVRGAEGGYGRWLRSAGGSYDGFLLSTANGFAPQLAAIIRGGGEGEPGSLSADSLAALVEEVFAAVARVPEGNAFANAAKAVDHFMAFGVRAAQERPPRLHSGARMNPDVLRNVGELLARRSVVPERGYLGLE